MKQGILYLAIGNQHKAEAMKSAHSIRFVCDFPIALVTDSLTSGGPFDFLFRAGNENVHVEKVKAIVNSPFEQTLYLDTDTRVLRNIDQVFALLDKFDFCAVADDYIDHDNAPYTLPVFNSGMIAYNAESVLGTFALWLDIVRDANGKDADQKHLRAALWERPVKSVSMNRNYNFRCDYPWQTWGRVAILHGRRHIDAAAEHINDSLRLRLWRANEERIEVLR